LATPPPAPVSDGLAVRVANLERTVGAQSQNGGNVQSTSTSLVSTDPNELTALLQRSLAIAQGSSPGMIQQAPTIPLPQRSELIQKAADVLNGILAANNGSLPLDPKNGSASLGQVNGALGDTLGNLLNGKKTAIGIIGATLTGLLSNVPPGTGLGQVLGMLT